MLKSHGLVIGGVRNVGKAEGIKEGMLRVAKQMLEKGALTEDVANWTGLSREEITDLGRGEFIL